MNEHRPSGVRGAEVFVSNQSRGVGARWGARALAVAAALLVALGAGGPARAEAVTVPAKLQAVLFKKIFAYDTALQGVGEVKVLVVYPAGGAEEARRLTGAFGEAGLTASAAEVHDATARLGGARVVYLLPGAEAALAHAAAAGKQVLSVAGLPALAERGAVSVALGQGADGKPEIVVNRTRLKAEGHDLSANLLRLARVIN
jgi:hypothetical protein